MRGVFQHWKTLQKILEHAEPARISPASAAGAAQTEAVFLPLIHEILERDQTASRKQWHTIQRIFAPLWVEQGYTGGLTVVSVAVRAWRASTAEVILPLSHPSGERHFNFGT